MLPKEPSPRIETFGKPSALGDKLRFGTKKPISSKLLIFCLSISAPPIACTDSGMSNRLSSLFLAVTTTSSVTSDSTATDLDE